MTILSVTGRVNCGQEDMKDDMLAKIIEELDTRGSLGGFIQNQMRGVLHGFQDETMNGIVVGAGGRRR